MFICCECFVLLGRGLCDKLITRPGTGLYDELIIRPEESYRQWSVVCDLETL